MTDYFALLGFPRRPWLDSDSLKHKFHALSAETHPDRVRQESANAAREVGDHYAELNAAFQCLREPKSRLHHLISLERGSKPGDSNQLPEALVRLFAEVGAVLKEAANFESEKTRASSSLQRALIVSKALPCLQRIAKLQAVLAAHRERLTDLLKALDSDWEEVNRPQIQPTSHLAKAENLYHQYGFLDRWEAQLRERSLQLTL